MSVLALRPTKNHNRIRIRLKANLKQLLPKLILRQLGLHRTKHAISCRRMYMSAVATASKSNRKNNRAKTEADLFLDSVTKKITPLARILNCLDRELRTKRSVVLICCHTLPLRYRSAIQPRRKERSSAQLHMENRPRWPSPIQHLSPDVQF